VLAVVVGGAVLAERVDEMISSVAMGISRPGNSKSGFVPVVGHLVVVGGLLLKRIVLGIVWAGLRLSWDGPKRGLQNPGLDSTGIGRLDAGSVGAKTSPANVLGSCWLRQVGVGSVRSEPGGSAGEILAIATVVDWGPSADDRPWLGSRYEKGG
jgi:hypothetical protein